METETLLEKTLIYTKEIIQTSIKVALSTAGPVRVAIDEILFGIGDRIRGRRLEKFVDELAVCIKSMDQNLINYNYLKSEEFHDILINTISKSIKTRHNEKIKIFAHILAGSLLVGGNTEKLEDCSEIIDTLGMRDIFILKEVINLSQELEKEKTNSERPNEFDTYITSKKLLGKTPFPESEIDFSLSRLSSLGLLKEYYEGNVFGHTPGGNYQPTDKIQEITQIFKTNNYNK